MRRVIAAAVSALLVAGGPLPGAPGALAQGHAPPPSREADGQGEREAQRRLDQAAQRLLDAARSLRDMPPGSRRDNAVEQARAALADARDALARVTREAGGERGWPFEAERPEGRAQALFQALDEARQAVRQGERDRAGSAIERAGRMLDTAGLSGLEEQIVGAWLNEARRAVREGERQRTWRSLQQARWALLEAVRQDRS